MLFKKILFAGIVINFFVNFVHVAAKDDVVALLKNIDELYRSDTSNVKIEMDVITPNWSRTLKMELWTKGMHYTFVRIESPRKERGVSSLKRGVHMWNYFPKINKVIKIPPSMMMGSWMGSDFTNDDLVKNSSLVKDYATKILHSKSDVIKLELIPKEGTVSLWGKIQILIDAKTKIPLKQEFFDEKGEKIRMMNFLDIKQIGGKTIPTTLELIPLNSGKKGHKTLVRYIKASFDIKIPDSIFTRANLQKRR